MTDPVSSLLHTRAIAVATVVFILATAVAVGLAFAGSDLLLDRRVSVPLFLVLLGSGAVALLGWATERTNREDLEREHADEVGQLGADLTRRERELRDEIDRAVTALEADREELQRREEQESLLTARLEGVEGALAEASAEYERRLDQAEEQAREERRRRERSEESRREEHEWALHLRSQVMELQRARGAIGDMRDVRALVLRTAITLTGAQKGLLLSRVDSDNDEFLDLIAHEGFVHDPSDSAVAQRFAREVIAKDVTVREDAESVAAQRRTPADDEIQSLLAVPIYIAERFQGVVVLANRPGGFDEKSDDVLLALGDHAGAVLHNARLRDELRGAYVATVRVLADAIEAKDRMLGSDSGDVAQLRRRDRRPPRARGEYARAARVRDPPARRGQARDQRADPGEAGGVDSRGALDRRAPPAHRLPARPASSRTRRRGSRRAPPPRALGRDRLPGGAAQAMRSRSRRGSSPSRTRSGR